MSRVVSTGTASRAVSARARRAGLGALACGFYFGEGRERTAGEKYDQLRAPDPSGLRHGAPF